MTTNNKQPDPDELTEGLTDLEWNAFRFVSGEMTDDQQAAFEIQLGDSPAAAVAVSRVLELGAAIERASSRPAVVVVPASTPSQAEPGRSSIVVVAALAACALVAFFLVPSDKITTPNTRVTQASQPVEVIETWLDVEPLQATFEPISTDEEVALELAMLEPVDLGTSDELVPDWMYVAFEDEDANGVSFE